MVVTIKQHIDSKVKSCKVIHVEHTFIYIYIL